MGRSLNEGSACDPDLQLGTVPFSYSVKGVEIRVGPYTGIAIGPPLGATAKGKPEKIVREDRESKRGKHGADLIGPEA